MASHVSQSFSALATKKSTDSFLPRFASKQNDLSRILYCRHLPAPKVLGCLSTHVLHICPSTARADSIEAQNGFNTNPVNLSVTQHKLNRPQVPKWPSMGVTWGNTGGHPKLKPLERNSSPGKTRKTLKKYINSTKHKLLML